MDIELIAKQCKTIISQFEENVLILCSEKDYQEDSEVISLYLAAKKYVERYGY